MGGSPASGLVHWEELRPGIWLEIGEEGNKNQLFQGRVRGLVEEEATIGPHLLQHDRMEVPVRPPRADMKALDSDQQAEDKKEHFKTVFESHEICHWCF